MNDNVGLFYALKEQVNVLPIFIFDKNILDKLDSKKDRRVTFIHKQLEVLQNQLMNLGSTLRVFYDYPDNVYKQLMTEYDIQQVYTNHDYEPYANQRDEEIRGLLLANSIPFHTYKDQCIFEKNEIVKDDGKWYSVYTPYSKKWLKTVTPQHLESYQNQHYFTSYLKTKAHPIPTLESMGFIEAADHLPDLKIYDATLKEYADKRDIPSVKGTSRISMHLRFGTVSIRELARKGMALSPKWLNELIWRDFYMMILHHNPHVIQHAFKPQYDRVKWRNNLEEFEKWCQGKTGYPIVDAGMRELNTTGFMHNRVRMITASFLVKHLLVDWRWGEAYFAEKLNDFELSSNNGGWQWASSSGCDAAPYFRVFNPELQMKKFDPDLIYIKRWVSEYQELAYQQSRIVDHKFARERALSRYKTALN
jgi:deoxyribodipyrimidine photo-lyase